MNDYEGCLAPIISIIMCIALVLCIMIGTNSCSAPQWNDGICPHCDTRYELRAANDGLKYYACPDCGNEVKRY
jgi:hypothetical protein